MFYAQVLQNMTRMQPTARPSSSFYRGFSGACKGPSGQPGAGLLGRGPNGPGVPAHMAGDPPFEMSLPDKSEHSHPGVLPAGLPKMDYGGYGLSVRVGRHPISQSRARQGFKVFCTQGCQDQTSLEKQAPLLRKHKAPCMAPSEVEPKTPIPSRQLPAWTEKAFNPFSLVRGPTSPSPTCLRCPLMLCLRRGS